MKVRELISHLQNTQLNNYQITTVEDIGGDIVINCPYHKGGTERTGSFSILLEDKPTAKGVLPAGTCHCFACGTSKTLPQFIADVTGTHDIEQSEEWLIREFNYSSEAAMAPITSLLQGFEKPLEVNQDLNYEMFRVNNHPFFEGRGINTKSIEFFELGIDEVFGYAVFPVKDKTGKTRMLFKRKLEGRGFYNTAGAKKEDLLYSLDLIYKNLSRFTGLSQLWVVESIIDAILLWQRGFVAVAMLQAIPTEQQLKLLQEVPFGEIIIATDNDEAGRKGRDLMVKELNKELYTIVYPTNEYKDVGDFKEMETIYIEKLEKPKQRNYTGLPLG